MELGVMLEDFPHHPLIGSSLLFGFFLKKLHAFPIKEQSDPLIVWRRWDHGIIAERGKRHASSR